MNLLLLVALAGQLPGGIEVDPRLAWYSYETGNFSVHFASLGRPGAPACSLARRVALLAEDVHARLCPAIGWHPRGRTNIIIDPSRDRTGGWATPFPDNTIVIYPSSVPGDKTNYDDWLRTLLVHEYSHIVQLNATRGLPRALGKVLGRIDVVNTFLPTWLIEGYATAAEARFTPFGNLRGAEYDAVLRSQARAGRLLPIDRWSTYELGRYPAVLTPYVYGGSFLRYLAPDLSAWDRFSALQSGTVPYFEATNARRVFGTDFERAAGRWQAWQKAYADTVRRRLESEPLTAPRRLTAEGYYTASPCWSRDGRELYYISRTGCEYPAIKAVDTATGRTRVLHRGDVTGAMALSPDGRWLAFCQSTVEDYCACTDVYLLDAVHGRVRQLTRRAHAVDPDFSPDSGSIVYVGRHDGQSELVRLDLTSGAVESLTTTTDRASYHCPRYSPNGRYLAVGINRPGGYADIEVIDTRTNWRVPVTEDRANDLSPAWSATGRHLFFVSDRSGVYNLYAWSLETQEVRRCTNLEFGAFEPRVAPDNRTIAVVAHSDRGYDLATIPLDARNWQPAEPFIDTLPDSPAPVTAAEPKLYYYNPFPAVLPKFWLPYAGYDGRLCLGALTLGWDALRQHQYSVVIAHRFGDEPWLRANYEFGRTRVVPALAFECRPSSQVAELRLALPFRRERRRTTLYLDAVGRHDSLFSATYGFSAGTSSAFQYRYSVAPVEGQQAGLSSGLESRALGSDRDRIRLLGWWHQHFGAPPRNWSLRLTLAAGSATADSAWSLGTGTAVTGVRGYGSGSPAGRNIALAKAQFRTPLCWPERGVGTLPVFLRDVNAALFADCGMAWTDARRLEPRLGLGAELRADLVLGHLLPVSLSAGCAAGVGRPLSGQVYLAATSEYLSGLLRRPGADLDEREPAGP